VFTSRGLAEQYAHDARLVLWALESLTVDDPGAGFKFILGVPAHLWRQPADVPSGGDPPG
jgi:hypothetical protein